MDARSGTFATAVDYSQWMASANLTDKQLWQVTLPGTHDSGAFNLSSTIAPSGEIPDWVATLEDLCSPFRGQLTPMLRDWGEAQDDDIYGQLAGGIRYLDVRPVLYEEDLYVYHGLLGSKFADVLGQIKRFISGVTQELVIVNVSHFRRINDGQHRQLIQKITDTLGDFLYNEPNDHLLTTTIGEFVAHGPRVLLVYRDDYAAQHPTPGIWPSLAVTDDYSDTPDFPTMEADQTKKLQAKAGTANHLFLLAWTLTPDYDTLKHDLLERVKPFGGHPTSLHKLSRNANKELAAFVQQYSRDYRINILSVDFHADAQVTDLAIAMNKQG